MDTFFYIFGIVAVLFVGCNASGTPIGNNECLHTRSRRATIRESTLQYYDSYTQCGRWFSRRRCHRVRSRTVYRTAYHWQYYNDTLCCPGYVRHSGRCKRAVLGFEKPLYYLEKDGCTMSVCAKLYENNVGSYYDSQVYTLNYRVTSRYGSRVKDGKMFLSSSVRRHCINMDISRSYRTQGDLTIVLTRFVSPTYAVISPSSSTIRPREDISIGFEETEMEVYENAGSVSLCVGILRPTNLNRIENINFRMYLYTRSASGSSWDFHSYSSSVSLSIRTRRTCRSISIVSDHIHEENEEFQVVLSGRGLPDYVTTTPSTARVKIINVERNFTIGFDLAELEVVESAGTVDICISSSINNFRNGAVTLKVLIPMSHENDLSFSKSTIRFNGANTRQCLALNITDDSSLEGNEVVVLMLEVESTTQPFYMGISPSSMKLKVIDDDSITIGFNSSVVEFEKGSTIQVCVHVYSGADLISDTINLIVRSEPGTADARHYLAFGGLFSTDVPENCYSAFIFPYFTSDDQPRTFSMSLFLYSNAEKVILDPQTVLIKITDKGTSSCTSGRYHCELGCSASSNWTKSLSSKVLKISDDVCKSGEAVIKSRDSSDGCTSKGQFCIESMEEKLIRSFQLGISPQLYTPESESGTCNPNSRKLNCPSTKPLSNSEECRSTRPSICQSRSVLAMLDTSSSVGPESFKLMTDAVAELTQHFCGNVQLAVAKFNQDAYLDRCFSCPTKSRFELSRFIKNNVAYESKGSNGNFENAACINNQVFSDTCGNHTQSDCIDVIYVTDGDISNSSCGQVKAWLSSRDTICSKSRVFAIGVGKKVSLTDLHCIASIATEDVETTFQFDTFTDLRKYVADSVQQLYKKKKECKLQSTGSPCDRNRIDLACDN